MIGSLNIGDRLIPFITVELPSAIMAGFASCLSCKETIAPAGTKTAIFSGSDFLAGGLSGLLLILGVLVSETGIFLYIHHL